MLKEIYKKIVGIRFNLTFPLHQKATKLKWYKTWSELKFSEHFHVFIFLIYLFGIFTGFITALPQNSKATLSGEPIITQISQGIKNKFEVASEGNYIAYFESVENSSDIILYNKNTKESLNITNSPTTTESFIYISNNKVSWLEYDNDTDYFIAYVYEIDTAEKFKIAPLFTSSNYGEVYSFNNDNAVFRECTNGGQTCKIKVFDLNTDSDDNNIPNYKEEITPDPLLSISTISDTAPNWSVSRVVRNNLGIAWSEGTVIKYYSYALNNTYEFQVPVSTINVSLDEEKIIWTQFNSETNKVFTYDLSIDSDTNGIPNFAETTRPNPDPALFESSDLTPQIVNLISETTFNVYNGKVLLSTGDLFLYDLNTNTIKRVTSLPSGSGAINYSSISDAGISWVDDRTKIQQVYNTVLDPDNTEPVFVNLPNKTTKINFYENEIVDSSNVTVQVKPIDQTSKINRVDYYVDGSKMGTSNTPDNNGVYSLTFDIPQNKTTGVTIKARAFDSAYNYSDISVNVKPDPLILPYLNTTRLTDTPDITEYTYAFNGQYYSYNSSLVRLTDNQVVFEPTSKILLGKDYFIYFDQLGSDFNIYAQKFSNIKPEYINVENEYNQLVGTINNTNDAVISNNTVYWVSGNNVYGKNIVSGEDYLIYSGPDSINRINAYNNNVIIQTGSKYLLLDTAGIFGEFAIPDGYSNIGLALNQTKVIVAESTNSNVNNLTLIDIASGTRTTIFSNNTSIDNHVTTNDNFVIFGSIEDSENYLRALLVYDFTKQKLFTLSGIENNNHNGYPIISNNKVVYSKALNDGNYDIYITEIKYQDIFKPEITDVTGLFGGTGGTANVKVYANDNVKVTRGYISINGGAYQNMSGTTSPFSFTVPIPNTDIDRLPIKIKVADISGNFVEKNYLIAVNDKTNPSIEKVEGLTGTTGEHSQVIITAKDNVDVYKVEVDSGGGYKSATLENGVWKIWVPVTLNSISPVKLTIKVTDLALNTFIKTDSIITVSDNDKPELLTIGIKNDNLVLTAKDNITLKYAQISTDQTNWKDMTKKDATFTYSLRGLGKAETAYIRIYDETGNVLETSYKIDSLGTTNAGESNLIGTLSNAFALVQGAFTDTIKETPKPVAYTFPYLLFATFILIAFIMSKQIKDESAESRKKIEIINYREAIVREKSNFANLASHYLRTPITLISNGYDLIKDKLKKAEGTKANSAIDNLVKDSKAVILSAVNITVPEKSKKAETIKLILNPFIIFPILIIAGLGIWANYLFVNVAKISINTTNYVTQAAFFVIAASIFINFFRKRFNQKSNIKNFEEVEKTQVKLDEARTEFMINLTKIIGEDCKKIESLKFNNEYINIGLGRLDDLISKTKVLSGFDIEDVKNEKSDYKVDSIIKDTITKIKTGNVKVKVQNLENAKTDKSKKVFSTILYEIIDNAVKFSEGKGEVNISIKERRKYIDIVVADNGKGIPAKDQEALFKPFSRTDSALTFNHEGAGLGLYYAKTLSNLLGGDLNVASVENKGTKVTIILPK